MPKPTVFIAILLYDATPVKKRNHARIGRSSSSVVFLLCLKEQWKNKVI
jgi:hypothetical protein